MRRVAVIIMLGLVLGGCWCRHCQGTEVWNNDLVIDATEAKEFKTSVEDLWNLDPASVADMMFMIATGAEIPTATATVTINTAQNNRWFNTLVPTSCLSRIYWHLAKVAVQRHKVLRDRVMQEAAKQAAIQIDSPTREARFISRLEILSGTTEEEY